MKRTSAVKAALIAVLAVIAVTAVGAVTLHQRSTQPAEAIGAQAGMGLRVFADIGKGQLTCDLGAFNRTCDVLSGSPFVAEVVTNPQPKENYTAFQATLQYSEELSLNQQVGLAESRAPKCNAGTESKDPPAGGDPGLYSITCGISGVPTSYSGPLANVRFVCSAGAGTAQLVILAGTSTDASLYLNPDIFGDLIFLASQSKGGKLVADAVQINCIPDSDLDGCSDAQEAGSIPTLGGVRNSLYFWDFFDTWTLSDTSSSGWVRDRQVDLFNDVFGVAQRFGAMRGSQPTKLEAFFEALNPPPIGDTTGYNAAFDRGPHVGPNPNLWDLGPADGAIDLFNDIFGATLQFGHTCAGAL